MGSSRTFRVILDLMVVRFLGGYGTKPIHLFGGMGFTLCGAGILTGLITLYQKFFEGIKAHRNPLLMLAVFLFLLGVQAIGWACWRNSASAPTTSLRGKPIYRIAEMVNFEKAPAPRRSLRGDGPPGATSDTTDEGTDTDGEGHPRTRS